MALNPSIILAGQNVDFAGSMAAGNQLAAQTNQLRDQNALRDVYRTQGAGILQGNQGSLNALAAIDPGQAMQMQSGQLDMQATRQRMDMMSREEQRQLAAAKASMTAAEAAQAAAQIEDAVKMGLAIQDPAQWDAVMAQQAPDLVGQFNNRQALSMKYMSMAEVLKANAPPDPQSTLGKFYADQNAGLVPADAKPPSGDGFNINMGGGTDKQIFDAMLPLSDMARTTATGYNAIKEAKAAVDAGIISGFGADNILSLQKLGAALGIADPTAIQNTETFRSAIAPQIAAILKATAGTANLSDSDRQFAEKAAGGNITLDEGSIKKLLGIMEKASRKSLEAYVGRLDQVYPNSPEYTRERAILGVQLPEFLPEDGTVPPPEAIDMLRQNNTPDFQRSFDEIFGQGAAARALGGN